MLNRSAILLNNKVTVRIVSINDVYELHNLPRLHTLISKLTNPHPSAVVVAGDFISPSTLSSIDGGRGMVSSLRAVGLTHASLGNHEADVKLKILRDRVRQLGKKDQAVVLNSNVIPSERQLSQDPEEFSWMTKEMKKYDIVTSHCGNIKIGLMGLLGDEEGIFRDGTFKGVPVHKLETRWDHVKRCINFETEGGVHALVAMTHQSLARDRTFARHILRTGTGTNSFQQKQSQPAVIIGGHEHQPFLETVRAGSKKSSNYVQIVKTGQDADRAAIIDFIFDPIPHTNTKSHRLDKISIKFEEVGSYEESPKVRDVVDKRMKVIADMEATNIIDKNLLPQITSNNTILSSKRTRFQQTTVGAFFCQAIKHELEVDVCIMNGAPIKGDADYPSGCMSYSQLKNELPFPVKMVVVKMTRALLKNVISYSRLSVDSVKPKEGGGDFQYEEIERRGYLQTDYDYWLSNGKGDKNDILSVAVPRNILNGFCSITPLVTFGEELKKKNKFPSSDDFMKAIDIVVRFCCKERWISLFAASNKEFTFEDLDTNCDGVLDRNEIQAILTTIMGKSPSDILLDDMMDALDQNEDGTIDEMELRKILEAAEQRNRQKSA